MDLQTRFPVTPNGSMALFEATKRTAVSIWDLGLSRVNSGACQILRSASKRTEILSRQGCAKKYVLICNNIPGEFAPCCPSSVVSPQFRTLPVINVQHRSPDFLLLIFVQPLPLYHQLSGVVSRSVCDLKSILLVSARAANLTNDIPRGDQFRTF